MSNLKKSIGASGRGLLIGVFVVGLGALLLVASMIVVAHERINERGTADKWVEHSHQVIVAVGNVLASIDDVETGERGYLLTGDAAFLQPYESGAASLWVNFHAIADLVADNPDQTQSVEILESLLRAKLDIATHGIELARAGDLAGAINIVRDRSGKIVMDKARQRVAAIINAENSLLDRRVVRQVESQDWVDGLLVGLLIIAASGVGLCAVWVIDNLLGRARRMRATMAATERDERLAMVDLAAVMWRDSDGVIRFWSQGCRKIYGWTAEQMVGHSMRDQVAMAFPDERGDFDDGMVRNDEWSGDRRGRTSDGTEIIVAVTRVARRDPNGRVFAVIETITDVTELRNVEKELRESQIRFAAVVDAAADGIIVARTSGSILTANQAALRMFGYNCAEELIGRDLSVLMPATEAAQHGNYIAKNRAGMQPRIIGVPGRELLAIRHDGSEFPIDLSVSSFETNGQRCLTGIVRDVTERNRAETALRDSDARLRLMQKVGGIAYYDRILTEPAGMITEEFVRLYGLPSEQTHILATEAIGFLHPDDRERVVAARDWLLAGGPTSTLEGRIVRADGSVRWLAMHTEVIRGPNGLPYRLVSAQRDITDIIDAKKVQLDRQRELEQRVTDGSLALSKSEEHMRLALSAVNSIGTYDWDVVNDLVYGNGTFARIFGIDPDRAAAGAPIAEYLVNVPADARAKVLQEYGQALKKGGDCSVIHPVNQPDGSVRWCLAKSHCVLAADGTPLRMPGVLIDITDQRIVEDQLRQSQKMEAVGQLTGGLAHDFNNMLQGITGSLELLKARLAAGRLVNVDRYITAAQGDAARAATLTQRLLAFSRRQVLDPVSTNADELIAGMADLIQRTVGPAIKIVTVPTNGLWTTLCDINQMENALLNLCINARDAMPQGGLLTIETRNVLLDRRGAFDWDVMPGDYIAVCVTDTGIGMPLDVVARAFDPFFTTKPLGVGTGLGLSMIYGFAQQSGGQARIYSEVGVGTTVRIYLPRHLATVESKQPPIVAETPPRAEVGQTVLIVDDEDTVRMLVTEVLQEHGYVAIEAVDGASGLKVLNSDVHIDLLISDVGLPGGMNGRQMADAARIGRPDLKVLFITGYAPNAVVGSGRLEQGMQVMTKPFALDTLASRIRDLITEVSVV
jgi:PAS domain S-box-containing protein